MRTRALKKTVQKQVKKEVENCVYIGHVDSPLYYM